MCGIVLLQGPSARARMADCLGRLKHRGPDDDGVWEADDVAIGFTRLAINGEGLAGRQPHHHGGLVGVVNGEIYNHQELTSAFGLEVAGGDTDVVLPLLERRGSQVIEDLDGFYAAIAFRPATRELICLRDHIGKKPLFVGRSRGELFMTSELKALDGIDWFELLPRGVARVELDTGRVTLFGEHQSVGPSGGIVALLDDAVRKRMPRADQPVGVFLSGGLDSSLVAAMACRHRRDVSYFTLGDHSSPDRRAVQTVVNALGLSDVRIIPVPPPASIPELVKSIVWATESYNPSVVSNGVATFLLARAAHDAGIKVVLTGEGADELFGGYHAFQEHDQWRETRAQLIDDMQFTELRRLDLCCMAHSVEARCPFLDRAVRGFSERLTYSEMYSGDENKTTLRHSFEGVLPRHVLCRPKTSLDVGSGIRRAVVQYLRRNGKSEREELLTIWRDRFAHDPAEPYFHSYPVFDVAIDRRGEVHR